MSSPREHKGFFRRLAPAFKAFGYKKGRKAEKGDETERIRVMYECFREILSLNDTTLQLIADIEDRLSGRVEFSLNAIVRRIRRGVLDVFAMVKDLDQLAPGKYKALYDSLRRINAEIESGLSAPREVASGPLVIPLQNLRAGDSSLAGAKMANLGEIKNVLGLSVPDGFVVTTTAFTRFMSQNDFIDRAQRLEELLEEYGQRVTAEASRELQQAIINAPLDKELENAIEKGYAALSGGEEILLAVRSSGVGEDNAASHAGLYYTELNVGKSWLLDSYRWVLASSYQLGALLYRLKYGLTSEDAYMAVGCLRMIEPRCSGVIFSRSFDDSEADKVVISVTPGEMMGGDGANVKTADLIVSSGLESDQIPSCLREDDLTELIKAARRLETHFRSPQDIEWLIGRDDRLYIVQSRSMVALKPLGEKPKLLSEMTPEPLLSGGAVACPGAAMGKVYRVKDPAKLEGFPDGAVLVTLQSSPRFAQVMSRCAAIVAEQGSPISHMAILAREYNVPTIVGVKEAMSVLNDGMLVTVDATGRRIFEGEWLATEAGSFVQSVRDGSPAIQRLLKLARLITPLQLVDATSQEFAPENCRSLHDITRYVHEKVFEEIFYLGYKASLSTPAYLKLDGNLPYDVLILDVGGGLAEDARKTKRVPLSQIVSYPMKAFMEGLCDARIVWDKPRAVSTSGFISVLGESIAGPPAEAQGVGRPSFAIISDRYMNFSTKAGYHFNTVDTYCGKSLNKNYIHFRFEGGAATETRRERRVKFLNRILSALNFEVQCRGDIVVARLQKYDREFMYSRLIELGRLTLCCRQLDMLMDTDDSPEFFARAFLADEMDKF